MQKVLLAAAVLLTTVVTARGETNSPPLWPPTGYVCGQPVRNFWRFCGDCQLRQAARVERWRQQQQQRGT